MFGNIAGILKGNKLADASARICQDVVNFLIRSGIELKLPNTAYILRESYCLCTFAMMNPNSSVTHKGAMAEQAKDILKDWLIDVFKNSSPEYDYEEGVEAEISELIPQFADWAEELHESHPELHGTPIRGWIQAAISQFITHVESYISEKHEHVPTNFSELLLTTATNSLRVR